MFFFTLSWRTWELNKNCVSYLKFVLFCCIVALKRSHFSSWFEPMPSYVVARGPRAMAAYQRAKATGKTLDRRVKVLLIGQDRVGKTSVGRSLKGEQFRINETSTDGVQMHEPLKNPGVRPWKFSTMQQETTAYHHKCAEYIGRELLAEAKAEETRAYEEFINTFPRPTKRPRPSNQLSLESLDLILDLTGVKMNDSLRPLVVSKFRFSMVFTDRHRVFKPDVLAVVCGHVSSNSSYEICKFSCVKIGLA